MVWTVLYVLMGTASYLVLTSGRPNGLALLLYGAQLLFNFFWPLFFFNMQAYLFAFVWLVLLWLLILAATILFFRISRPAGWLMVPYLLWVAFAGYLNLSIYLLNWKSRSVCADRAAFACRGRSGQMQYVICYRQICANVLRLRTAGSRRGVSRALF